MHSVGGGTLSGAKSLCATTDPTFGNFAIPNQDIIDNTQMTRSNQSPSTLYDKIWSTHIVHEQDNETALIYIDAHIVYEITSPQAFDGLRAANRKLRRPDLTLST